tara:strand:- start:2203 stop:2463 length:261 start_codon:yes stop_codon:yes gene_type:complete
MGLGFGMERHHQVGVDGVVRERRAEALEDHRDRDGAEAVQLALGGVAKADAVGPGRREPKRREQVEPVARDTRRVAGVRWVALASA